MKQKTNRQIFKQAIQNLDDITLAILRERILSITEATLRDKEEVKKQMTGSFFNPDSWIGFIEKIHEQFKFENSGKFFFNTPTTKAG
jgi:hypothetical protein